MADLHYRITAKKQDFNPTAWKDAEDIRQTDADVRLVSFKNRKFYYVNHGD